MAKLNKKTKISIITAGLVLASVGAAFAYWTAGGSGTDSATTGDNVALTINQTSTVAGMAPGDSPQGLSGDFDNSNSGPVYVATVTASISSVVKAGGAPAGTCDATDYTLAGAVMTVGTEVPAGTGVGSWSGATIQFNNKGTIQDACKGATVNLAYAAS
jgi:hypothetical protein